MEEYLKEKVVLLEENESLKSEVSKLAKRAKSTDSIESKITMLATENERLLATREDIQK
jgi:cell division septum initiation protein DivIVA